ncbi:sialate O-acetylesterase [Flammeovirgaceae bacterium 311]|nr:sialate O-acetylesterase [Flammeovirgaceae bacterium 311]
MKYILKQLVKGVGCCLILQLGGSQLLAKVKLPALFADNMVLQQQEKVALWGWADPGERVEIRGSWHPAAVASVTADPEGKWKTTLKTAKAGGPYTLTFKGLNTIILEQVLLGEVWICSGQSNMHFPVAPIENSGWASGVVNYEQELAEANYPTIRMFTVERKVADIPQEDVEGSWEICSPETVGDFSAVAYFFARELNNRTGLPVGLINASWGGTPAESWTRKEILEEDADFRPILTRYQKDLEKYPEAMKAYQLALANWQKEAEGKKSRGENSGAAPREPIGQNHHRSPFKLYNAMIAPIIPYTIKGAIWYQGESNANRAYQYRKLFPAMISNWRQDWNLDFPFYFAQIAPHRGQRPEIREAQLMTLQSVPKTGMAVLTDAGDSLDIHPQNKQVVGKRLALWALAKDYNKKIAYSGPLYKSMKVKEGKIYLEFEHTEGGLLAIGGPLREFNIAGADQQFVPAQAEIEGKKVVVWSDSVADPVAVRFAWKRVPEPNFYNGAGLPASPFRTDQWKTETYTAR